jgi:hypothetical protein
VFSVTCELNFYILCCLEETRSLKGMPVLKTNDNTFKSLLY